MAVSYILNTFVFLWFLHIRAIKTADRFYVRPYFLIKSPYYMSMTFYVGNTKLKDGTAIKHERENLRPGDPILTKDGGTLPNGTYTDAKGKSFTVANGKVGQIGVAAPVEPVVVVEEPVVVIEPVAETVKVEPVENPIVETVVITPETPAT